tara:strand:- start:119 stop:427 length:309 start_codon:yes stop_codon:yes gene_type:complete
MDITDIVGEVGQFLTCEELFKFSRVDSIWKNAFLLHKKQKIQQIKQTVMAAHYCGNLCPCSIRRLLPGLEHYYIKNPIYNLKKLVCLQLNGKKTPVWFDKYR